jgi:hypothetical protein
MKEKLTKRFHLGASSDKDVEFHVSDYSRCSENEICWVLTSIRKTSLKFVVYYNEEKDSYRLCTRSYDPKFSNPLNKFGGHYVELELIPGGNIVYEDRPSIACDEDIFIFIELLFQNDKIIVPPKYTWNTEVTVHGTYSR